MPKSPGCSLTRFENQFATLPSAEYPSRPRARTWEYIAPIRGARVIWNKPDAPHFVTCALKDAPYIGKTAEKQLRINRSTHGKQRSSYHVTESDLAVFDFDDIDATNLSAILRNLEKSSYVAYSTHSHGTTSGLTRMRAIVSLDRPVGPMEWTRVWHVFNDTLFGGKADKATAKMHQAAAMWCAHPDRVAQSFRHEGHGQSFSVDKLLALAPPTKPPPSVVTPRAPSQGNCGGRYADALRTLDAGNYTTWQSVFMSLQAGVVIGDLTDAEGYELFSLWSATAPASRRTHNDQTQYDPAAMWQRKPTLTTQAAILVGSLFAKAKAVAIERFESNPSGTCDADARRAERYLRQHHKFTYRQLKAAK